MKGLIQLFSVLKRNFQERASFSWEALHYQNEIISTTIPFTTPLLAKESVQDGWVKVKAELNMQRCWNCHPVLIPYTHHIPPLRQIHTSFQNLNHLELSLCVFRRICSFLHYYFSCWHDNLPRRFRFLTLVQFFYPLALTWIAPLLFFPSSTVLWRENILQSSEKCC